MTETILLKPNVVATYIVGCLGLNHSNNNAPMFTLISKQILG